MPNLQPKNARVFRLSTGSCSGFVSARSPRDLSARLTHLCAVVTMLSGVLLARPLVAAESSAGTARPLQTESAASGGPLPSAISAVSGSVPPADEAQRDDAGAAAVQSSTGNGPPHGAPPTNVDDADAEPTPVGSPPPIHGAARNWKAPDGASKDGEAGAATAEDQDEPPPDLHRHLAAGAQVFAVADKVIVGAQLRFGAGWVWFHTEASPVWLLERSEQFDGSFLGNQFGGYFALSPWNTEALEVHLGLGCDAYWLWGIHADKWELALGARGSVHWWPAQQFGLMATLRTYPVSTQGLELGVDRGGAATVPVLGSIGIEWRPR